MNILNDIKMILKGFIIGTSLIMCGVAYAYSFFNPILAFYYYISFFVILLFVLYFVIDTEVKK